MPRLLSKHGPPPSVVAARIKAERERLGLTMAEAARRLGVAKATYANLEHTANPQYGTIVGLVTVLGFDARAICPELHDGGEAPLKAASRGGRPGRPRSAGPRNRGPRPA